MIPATKAAPAKGGPFWTCGLVPSGHPDDSAASKAGNCGQGMDLEGFRRCRGASYRVLIVDDHLRAWDILAPPIFATADKVSEETRAFVAGARRPVIERPAHPEALKRVVIDPWPEGPQG